jgi:hypothetical protein
MFNIFIAAIIPTINQDNNPTQPSQSILREMPFPINTHKTTMMSADIAFDVIERKFNECVLWFEESFGFLNAKYKTTSIPIIPIILNINIFNSGTIIYNTFHIIHAWKKFGGFIYDKNTTNSAITITAIIKPPILGPTVWALTNCGIKRIERKRNIFFIRKKD